jgi:hypothetical protein
MIEILNIENILKKNITNYKKIYNFIFLYKEELINILEDQTTIYAINENIDNNAIDLLIKNIDKSLNKIENINLNAYIDFYINIEELNKLLHNNIIFINTIDIYEKKFLISDTSKNNINQNKTLILDLYKKYNIENKKLLNESIISIFNNLDIVNKYNEIFLILRQHLDKNNNTISLYLEFINIIKTLELDSNFLEIINQYNLQLKDSILINELENINIKCNKNTDILFNNNKVFNNNYFTINKLQLFNNFANFSFKKQYKTLSELFSAELNITKFSKINYNEHEKISSIINLHYKLDKINLIIIIIKSNIDLINYNISSLLDTNDTIESNTGINQSFINKTKTIMTQSEYIKKIDSITNYISNIQNITIYHNKLLYNKENNNNAKHNTDVLLINYDNHNYNIYSNGESNFLKLKDVNNIIINKPNYSIENYNNIINNNITNKINNYNILNKYTESITNNYNLYSNINHIELKNIIINKIKEIKIPVNNNNKNKIIEEILELININIYNYILNKTNIEFYSEIYIVYLSNINSLLNKLKKELVDNYSDNFLINIDNIINSQYHNIQLIIENIIDKHYQLNL